MALSLSSSFTFRKCTYWLHCGYLWTNKTAINFLIIRLIISVVDKGTIDIGCPKFLLILKLNLVVFIKPCGYVWAVNLLGLTLFNLDWICPWRAVPVLPNHCSVISRDHLINKKYFHQQSLFVIFGTQKIQLVKVWNIK